MCRFPCPGAQCRRAAQGLGIRLTAAGRKHDLPGIGMQVPGKNLPGLGQLFRRPLSRCMQAGGIGVLLLEAGHHGLQCRLTQSGCCRVIRINIHLYFLLFLRFTMI